jgi:hypothetical protein
MSIGHAATGMRHRDFSERLLLVIVYHLLREETCDDESRDDRQDASQGEREKNRAIAALERLG